MVLFRLDGYGERIAACPALAGLAELELACWYSDADARALAASPHLRALQVLELWLGYEETQLCRIIAAGQAWPNLRELSLLNCDNRDASSRKRLVAVANRAAGRAVAVYRPGYPDLFPFAADFYYVFPGRLPNGRAAIGVLDTSTEPPAIFVTTFGKHGNPIGKVIRVPLPDALLRRPKKEGYGNSELKQQLIDVLGFVPGFIRVRARDIPGDTWANPHWHWEVWDDMCGRPDIDNDGDWGEWPTGNGGEVRHHLRNQEWLFGHNRWADKTGRVHST